MKFSSRRQWPVKRRRGLTGMESMLLSSAIRQSDEPRLQRIERSGIATELASEIAERRVALVGEAGVAVPQGRRRSGESVSRSGFHSLTDAGDAA